MKKKRFSVEQIVGVLKQAQVGVPVAEVIRKAAISEQTFYRWKAKYAGLEVDEVRKMAQLQEENMRLKQLDLQRRFFLPACTRCTWRPRTCSMIYEQQHADLKIPATTTTAKVAPDTPHWLARDHCRQYASPRRTAHNNNRRTLDFLQSMPAKTHRGLRCMRMHATKGSHRVILMVNNKKVSCAWREARWPTTKRFASAADGVSATESMKLLTMVDLNHLVVHLRISQDLPCCCAFSCIASCDDIVNFSCLGSGVTCINCSQMLDRVTPETHALSAENPVISKLITRLGLNSLNARQRFCSSQARPRSPHDASGRASAQVTARDGPPG